MRGLLRGSGGEPDEFRSLMSNLKYLASLFHFKLCFFGETKRRTEDLEPFGKWLTIIGMSVNSSAVGVHPVGGCQNPLLATPDRGRWTLPGGRFSAPRDDTARASCGNGAKSNFLL